jgi:hypothetical protein
MTEWYTTSIMAFMWIATFSFLYKPTKLFKFLESTIVGILTGHWLMVGVTTMGSSIIIPAVNNGNFFWIIPLLVGLLLFTRWVRGAGYLAIYPSVILIGAGTGLLIRGFVDSNIIAQVVSTIGLGLGPYKGSWINNILFLISLISTLAYFVFTIEQKGTYGILTRMGRTFLLMAIGVTFAGAIMNRTGAVTGWLIQLAVPIEGQAVIALVLLFILYDIMRNRGKT